MQKNDFSFQSFIFDYEGKCNAFFYLQQQKAI